VFVALQYLLPHHLLCRLVYALTRSRVGWLKNLLIGAFMRGYRPTMEDAAEPTPRNYESFNAFFTRALRPGARLNPPDAQDIAWGARLAGGLYATIYLAPYNYHRVHMPLAGRLIAAWHVPGRLFSVNQRTAASVPALFARNERVVCAFEGDRGPFVVILVGALFVGSMSTVWHREVTPSSARRGARALVPVTDSELALSRGAELGRFNMGSTVILLLPPGAAHWDDSLRPGATLRVGQQLGRLDRPA